MYKAHKYTELPAECRTARDQEQFEQTLFLLAFDKAHLGFIHGDPTQGTRIRFMDWLELEDRGYTS